MLIKDAVRRDLMRVTPENLQKLIEGAQRFRTASHDRVVRYMYIPHWERRYHPRFEMRLNSTSDPSYEHVHRNHRYKTLGKIFCRDLSRREGVYTCQGHFSNTRIWRESSSAWRGESPLPLSRPTSSTFSSQPRGVVTVFFLS